MAVALADRLIAGLGGLARILATNEATIERIAGRSVAAHVAAIQAALSHALESPIRTGPVLSNWSALIDYVRLDIANLRHERVRVLYLDTANALIRNEVASEGTIDQAPVSVREIVIRALDLGAASLILVHNHPSGNPTPSKQDILLTRQIVEAVRPLGIAVYDHIVMGLREHASFRALGLL